MIIPPDHCTVPGAEELIPAGQRLEVKGIRENALPSLVSKTLPELDPARCGRVVADTGTVDMLRSLDGPNDFIVD